MNKTFDPFDELAAMFLTAPADGIAAPPDAKPMHANGSATGRPQAAAVPIELLVAGHLPVRGGLWLTPYADAVAREHGCTALLRLDHDDSSLQVLGPHADQVEQEPDRTLRQAIAQVGGSVDRWIIRAAPGSNPVELLGAGADQLTILSSADEAAIVAAYQL